jgi:acylphosphatase
MQYEAEFMVGKHVIFVGRVQGVGFRYTALRIAKRFRLTGFVRNKPDGTVEMLAQGSLEEVETCVEEIQDYFGDYISGTTIDEVPPNPRYTDFRITF